MLAQRLGACRALFRPRQASRPRRRSSGRRRRRGACWGWRTRSPSSSPSRSTSPTWRPSSLTPRTRSRPSPPSTASRPPACPPASRTRRAAAATLPPPPPPPPPPPNRQTGNSRCRAAPSAERANQLHGRELPVRADGAGRAVRAERHPGGAGGPVRGRRRHGRAGGVRAVAQPGGGPGRQLLRRGARAPRTSGACEGGTPLTSGSGC